MSERDTHEELLVAWHFGLAKDDDCVLVIVRVIEYTDRITSDEESPSLSTDGRRVAVGLAIDFVAKDGVVASRVVVQGATRAKDLPPGVDAMNKEVVVFSLGHVLINSF